MAKHASTTELRKMSIADLTAEVRESQNLIAKLRLGVTMQKEKDTAKLQKEKKHLARMQTVLSTLKKEETALSKAEKSVSSSGKK